MHVTTAAAAIFGFAYVFVGVFKRYLENIKPFKDLPMPDRSHWFYGHALSIFSQDFRGAIYHLAVPYSNEHGLSAHWLGSLPTLNVNNYRDARQILMTEYGRRNIGLLERHLMAFAGSNNILIKNGKEWKMKRDCITRTFDHDFMMESRTVMREVANELVKSIKSRLNAGESNLMDIQPLMKMVTLDAFGKMALSINFGCSRTLFPSKLALSFDFLIQEFSRRMANPLQPSNFLYWLPTPTNLEHKQKKEVLYTYIGDLIKKHLEQKKRDNGILSRLVQAEIALKGSTKDISVQSLTEDIMVRLSRVRATNRWPLLLY